MYTKNYSVMILKRPLGKWDPKNRATDKDPVICTESGKLMTNKLARILSEHKEKVAISNSLVLEVINAYRKKSKRLKAAQEQLDKISATCVTLSNQKEGLLEHLAELELENARLKAENSKLSKKTKKHSHS